MNRHRDGWIITEYGLTELKRALVSDKVGLATVCSIAVNGALLKASVPVNSKFGGVLQMRNHRPLRFVELIYYTGNSMAPSEIFIRAKMTTVS